MRKFLFIGAFLAGALGAVAQEEPALVTEENDPNKQFTPISVVLNLNSTRLFDLSSSVDQKWFSRGLDVSLHYEFQFSKNFGFAPGIGFSTGNYFIDGTVMSTTDSVTNITTSDIVSFDDDFNFRRHKLSSNYVEIPLEFRFKSNPNATGTSYKVALGFKAGYMVNFHTKTVTSSNRFKDFNFDDINPLRFGPTFRFAYGRFGLSGFYSLSSLFEDGKGPTITPVALGITLLPY
ncbi:MAG: outer membrane beta-barrel protein [Salibacteraceae bacterium]